MLKAGLAGAACILWVLTSAAAPYLQAQGNAARLIVNGRPMLILGGELGNSSASSSGYMLPHWARLRQMHLNTVLAPVSWELIEPGEGRFNWQSVDSLVRSAVKGESKMSGFRPRVLEDATVIDTPVAETIGNYRFTVSFVDTQSPKAAQDTASHGGFIIQAGPEDYLVAGQGMVVTFAPAGADAAAAGIDSAWEGHFDANGTWIPGRLLNGDQTHQGRHIRLAPGEFQIQRLRLYRYAGTAGTTDAPATMRADENSKVGHADLLRKAHAGNIRLYFLGDSITRRWGSADEQYRDLHDNWTHNFFGWDAADFGWGGDTTENILWRIENGELDGVRPKVIVLMAGTNNLTKLDLPGAAERVHSVVAGIKAILSVCDAKAPGAVIILMGVTPRNDDLSLLPLIEQINAELARLADGRRVRFLNLNDRLADEHGRLFPGMVNPDGLHLAVGAYQVWADSLRPILTELLGPRSKTDSAPPPTADPSVRKNRP